MAAVGTKLNKLFKVAAELNKLAEFGAELNKLTDVAAKINKLAEVGAERNRLVLNVHWNLINGWKLVQNSINWLTLLRN